MSRIRELLEIISENCHTAPLLQCNVEVWGGQGHLVREESDVNAEMMRDMILEWRDEAVLYSAKHHYPDHVLFCALERDWDLDIISTIRFFSGTSLSDSDMQALAAKNPEIAFYTITKGEARMEETNKRIVPLTLKEAMSR